MIRKRKLAFVEGSLWPAGCPDLPPIGSDIEIPKIIVKNVRFQNCKDIREDLYEKLKIFLIQPEVYYQHHASDAFLTNAIICKILELWFFFSCIILLNGSI